MGDVVHLSCHEAVPADLLLLHSSDPQGVCYVDSCSLDGESNLKQRQSVGGLVREGGVCVMWSLMFSFVIF